MLLSALDGMNANKRLITNEPPAEKRRRQLQHSIIGGPKR